MDTSHVAGIQKRQRYQQHGESKCRDREGIKRSQRNIPIVSNKELKDNIDELDQPNVVDTVSIVY